MLFALWTHDLSGAPTSVETTNMVWLIGTLGSRTHRSDSRLSGVAVSCVLLSLLASVAPTMVNARAFSMGRLGLRDVLPDRALMRCQPRRRRCWIASVMTAGRRAPAASPATLRDAVVLTNCRPLVAATTAPVLFELFFAASAPEAVA